MMNTAPTTRNTKPITPPELLDCFGIQWRDCPTSGATDFLTLCWVLAHGDVHDVAFVHRAVKQAQHAAGLPEVAYWARINAALRPVFDAPAPALRELGLPDYWDAYPLALHFGDIFHGAPEMWDYS